MGHKDQDQLRETKPPTGTQTGPHPGAPAERTSQDPQWRPDRPQGGDQTTRDMEQGDLTRPGQPSGTTPLERDQLPENQKR